MLEYDRNMKFPDADDKTIYCHVIVCPIFLYYSCLELVTYLQTLIPLVDYIKVGITLMVIKLPSRVSNNDKSRANNRLTRPIRL